jgi:DNA polymerase/3'-5' exonuclease PolX
VNTDVNTNRDNSEECYEALKTIAQYMIEGIEELQKTYEFGNAVFALQYYKELLQAGINESYNQEMLPKHLKDFTSQNFLDNDKIKKLWKNDDIINIAKLFKLCFESDKKTPSSIKAYRAAIESMLNDRDNIFKQMISSTNNS